MGYGFPTMKRSGKRKAKGRGRGRAPYACTGRRDAKGRLLPRRRKG